ncbi:MAG: BlaI/MecI/CopY family transcriptional regulator [Thermoplasmata archaeon]|nr:BlaI/MecI/CopY family transcriptional regulator [Thermoplasmata archaeon]MCI4341917.1 BlaI/MecI/CopY family transcriptional regulator [Thermoplasmata archaeon]
MLGSLESEVLSSLRAGGTASAKELRERLEARGIRVAYTTVATILSRLHSKGFVRRRREPCQGGARYVYRAVDFERKYLRHMLKGVVALFGPTGVVHLSEELDRIRPNERTGARRRARN